MKHPNKEGGEGESGSRAEGIQIRGESWPKGDEEGKGAQQGRRHPNMDGGIQKRMEAHGIQIRNEAHGRPRAKEASRAREEDARGMQVGRRRRWASRRRGHRRVRRRQSVRLERKQEREKEDRRHPKKEGGIQKRKEEDGRQGRSTRMLVAAVAAVAAAVANVADPHIPLHIVLRPPSVLFGSFGRFRPLRPSFVRSVRPVPFGCVFARHCPPLRSLPSPLATDLPPPSLPPPSPPPSPLFTSTSP